MAADDADPASAVDAGFHTVEVSDTEYSTDIGKIETKGPIAARFVETVARAHLGNVYSCYRRLLEKGPEHTLELRARIVLGADGLVESASVLKASVGKKGEEECAVAAIGGWSFPASQDGAKTVITLPFEMTVETTTRTVKVPNGPPPRIRSSMSSCCSSGLSKEVLRRIIHRKRGEIEYCHSLDPKKEGKVAVKFIVGGTGAVTMAAVASSTLGSAQVENCLATSMRRWTFPQPEGGGIVITTHEFELPLAGAKRAVNHGPRIDLGTGRR